MPRFDQKQKIDIFCFCSNFGPHFGHKHAQKRSRSTNLGLFDPIAWLDSVQCACHYVEDNQIELSGVRISFIVVTPGPGPKNDVVKQQN